MAGKKTGGKKKSFHTNRKRYPYFYALQNYLKTALKNSPDDLKTLLGYVDQGKCTTAIQKMLECVEPYEWLHVGHFDLTNTAETLLEKCGGIVSAGLLGKHYNSLENFQAEITKAKIESKRFMELQGSFVRVQTDFHRTTQPIFQLAFSNGILEFKLTVKDEWVEKGAEYALKTQISQMIRSHFEKNKGKVGSPFNSNILGYTFHLKDGGEMRQFYFDTQGKPADAPHPQDSNPHASAAF